MIEKRKMMSVELKSCLTEMIWMFEMIGIEMIDWIAESGMMTPTEN